MPGLAILWFAGALIAAAQQDNSARIRFIFENPKLQPANYLLDIYEDGRGYFKSEPGSISPPDAEGIMPQPLSTDITIEEPLRGLLFKTARSHNFFAVACESAKVKVAFTGKKALQYTGPDGNGACTFDWSRDQQLMKVADDLIAVAFTLEEGRRLTVEYEHDRLSLDAELESLQDSVKAGRAQQIQNIAPQLQAIAADEKVMDRARTRARALLGGNGKKG